MSPLQLERSSEDEHSMNSLTFLKEKRLDDIDGGWRVQEPLLAHKLTK